MKTDVFPYAFFDGRAVNIANAKVSIMTNALQYGTGVFGGIRGYWDEKEHTLSLFRVSDHFHRFLSSLRILGTTLAYSEKELAKITIDLVKKNKPTTDVYIRPFAYAGRLGLSPNLAEDRQFAFSMYMIPLGEYIPVDKGIKVKVSSFRRVTDNSIPSRAKMSGAYVNSALAKKEAVDHGYEEAIFLTENGHVAEGSAMNIFIVRNGILVTPPKSDDILEGITRATVITMARDLGIAVEERSIDRSELYIADEAFFTGTGAQVSWIGNIDGRVVGDGKKGPVTTTIQERFFKIVRGKDPKYSKWCTKIKITN